MKAESISAIVLDKNDNVATALRPVSTGELIQMQSGKKIISIHVAEDIPMGHKLALVDIRRGDRLIKYGEVIGKASALIPKGSHVHVHNLRGRGNSHR